MKSYNNGIRKEKSLIWELVLLLKRALLVRIRWCKLWRMVIANHFCIGLHWITTRHTWPNNFLLLICSEISKSMLIAPNQDGSSYWELKEVWLIPVRRVVFTRIKFTWKVPLKFYKEEKLLISKHYSAAK